MIIKRIIVIFKMNILEVEKINPCVRMAAELNELSVLREALRGGL